MLPYQFQIFTEHEINIGIFNATVYVKKKMVSRTMLVGMKVASINSKLFESII